MLVCFNTILMFGLTCSLCVQGSQYMDVVLSQEPLTVDRNFLLEPLLVEVGTLIHVC